MARVDIGGKLVEFPDGMSPDELQNAVSSAAKQLGAEPSFSDNLKTDAIEQAKGLFNLGKAGVMAPKAMLIDAPIEAARSVRDVVRGKPFSETPSGSKLEALAQTISEVPGRVADRVEEIATKRGQAFYEKPISTTLDVASVIPAVGMVSRAAKGAQLGQKIGGAGVRLTEAAFGAPRAAIERRLARGSEVANALPKAADAAQTPYAGLADDLARAVNEVGEKARKSASIAEGALSDSAVRAMSKEDVVSLITKQQERLKTQGAVVGKSKNQAFKSLEDLKEQVSSIEGSHISEKNIKALIKSLDPDIDWMVKSQNPQNLALERTRRGLDAKLKNQNPDYRDKMATTAREMRTYERSKRQFGLEREVGAGFVPSDATSTKLQSVGRGRVPVTEKKLEQLSRESGRDFTEKAKDINANLQFRGGATNGSRRIGSFGGIGTAVGGLVGGPVGAAFGGSAGAILGLITDTNGRAMAGKLIDAYLKVKPNATAMELIEANPTLAMIVKRSTEAETPAKMLAAYASSRSVPPKDR